MQELLQPNVAYMRTSAVCGRMYSSWNVFRELRTSKVFLDRYLRVGQSLYASLSSAVSTAPADLDGQFGGHAQVPVTATCSSDSMFSVKLSRDDEELLQKSIAFEAARGFSNVMGRKKRFSEFLSSKLSTLSLSSSPQYEKTLISLSNTAEKYDSIDLSSRVALLDKVSELLGFRNVQDLLDHHNALVEASEGLQTNADQLNCSAHNSFSLLQKMAHPAIVFGSSETIDLYGSTESGMSEVVQSSSKASNSISSGAAAALLELDENVESSGSTIQRVDVGRTPTSTRRIRRTAKTIRPNKTYESWLLNKPITLVNSLSSYMSSRLDENGFYTLRKLLQHYPRTYINFLQAGQIVEHGQYLTFFGKITSSRVHSTASLGIVEILISSEQNQKADFLTEKNPVILHVKKFFRGARYASKWFLNKVAEKYPVGAYAAVSGKVKALDQENHFEVKDYSLEVVNKEDERALNSQTEKVHPVYPSKGTLDPKTIQHCIQKALEDLPIDIDPLPEKYKIEHGIMDLRQAYCMIHNPTTLAAAEKARQRFVFDEFFYLQLGLLLQKQVLDEKHLAAAGLENSVADNSEDGVLPIENWAPLTLKMLGSLSYKLTNSQLRSVSEIMWDLQRPVPMRRLLQGDVGCGKTIVAFLALLEVIDAGFQGALMAPTEFLAKQQYKRFVSFLEHLDEEQRPKIALLTSSVPGVKARAIRKGLESGDIQLAIGTHSLIADSVKFASLRLVVIDEQHRFGVEQRIRLQNKGSLVVPVDENTGDEETANISRRPPHVLAMTATPIPRTLAFALYGDMALSQITELPPGRTPVKTYAMIGNEEGLSKAFQMVQEELESGGRVFIVYPIIDESEELPNVKAATVDFERIAKEFEGYNCGLVHGKLKPSEKEQAMEDFKSGQTQILVSTTVIEVGIDIVEASMMVVMNSERYGMAQLHQLRGRVGRGSKKSRCILLTSSQRSLDRVKVLEDSNDGFHLAEVDLKLRGPGDMLGKQQSGHLAEFSLARLEDDSDLMIQARMTAEALLNEYHGLEGLPRLKQELGFRQGLDSLGV